MEIKDIAFTPEAESIAIQRLKVQPNGLKQKAILFIHGFPSSPATYRFAAEQAQNLDYDVFAPRIPTFASDYHLFLKTKFEDWWHFIDQFYQELRPQYEHFFIVGTSMGGSLTLKLAESYCHTYQAPTAICTLDAPVEMPNLKPDWLFKFMAKHLPVIRPSYHFPTNKAQDGLENWVGYKGLFARQGYSLVQNLISIKKELPQINCPAICFHSTTDQTVDPINLNLITDNISSTKIKKHSVDIHHLYGHQHILLLYTEVQQQVFDTMIQFFNQQEFSK